MHGITFYFISFSFLSRYSGNSFINLYFEMAMFLVFINVVLHTKPLASGHNTIHIVLESNSLLTYASI